MNSFDRVVGSITSLADWLSAVSEAVQVFRQGEELSNALLLVVLKGLYVPEVRDLSVALGLALTVKPINDSQLALRARLLKALGSTEESAELLALVKPSPELDVAVSSVVDSLQAGVEPSSEQRDQVVQALKKGL